MVEMPARIVMGNGEEFVVDMEVDRAASDILIGRDPFAMLEAQKGGSTRRVYVMREHISHAEAYTAPEPFVSFGG